MKLNTSLVISTLTLIVGIFLNIPLWIPISVIIASIISLKVSSWVNSERLGSSAVLSSFLKLACSAIMFYAAIGQYICLALVVIKLILP